MEERLREAVAIPCGYYLDRRGVLQVAITDEDMAKQYRGLMSGEHGAEIRKRIGKLDDDLGGLVRGMAFLILTAVAGSKIVGHGPATEWDITNMSGVCSLNSRCLPSASGADESVSLPGDRL
jgi:hypothetical protein